MLAVEWKLVRIPDGHDQRPDHLLIEAINDGDARAFETLYHRYRAWVVRLAWRFTGNDADALDVLQETFAYLHRKCPNLTLTARLTTFLYPVVQNLSIQAKRKGARYAGDETALERAEGPVDVGRTLADEDLAIALRRLSELHREVVLMRYVDGMSIEEIAAALTVPEGTVKSRLHNAVEAMRRDEAVRRHLGEC